MSTKGTTKTAGKEEPVLVPPTEEAPTPEPKTSKPEPDVKLCSFTAKGTFDKGIVDCEVSDKSKIDLDRTQIIILVKDGRRYTYDRTNIE